MFNSFFFSLFASSYMIFTLILRAARAAACVEWKAKELFTFFTFSFRTWVYAPFCIKWRLFFTLRVVFLCEEYKWISRRVWCAGFPRILFHFTCVLCFVFEFSAVFHFRPSRERIGKRADYDYRLQIAQTPLTRSRGETESRKAYKNFSCVDNKCYGQLPN